MADRKEYQKEWHKNHKEHLREYLKEWRKNNKEHKREYAKEWRESHKEHKREYQKKWRINNPGHVQRYNAERRTKEKSLVNTLTFEEWIDILDAFDYKCAYCGAPFTIHNMPTRDHIIPLSKDGGNIRRNIVPACKSCNSKKHVNITADVLIKLAEKIKTINKEKEE